MISPVENSDGLPESHSSTSPLVNQRMAYAPLIFALFLKEGVPPVPYCEETADETLDLVRADILSGKLPFGTKTLVGTRLAGQESTKEGTLLKCSLKYPKLANLYMPVRRRSINGMLIGAIAGPSLYLLAYGFKLLAENPLVGLAMIALAISLVVSIYLGNAKVKVKFPWSLIPWAFPLYLGFNGKFIAILFASVFVPLLCCMPGMAIGAIVGTIQRRHMVLAPDAPRENAVLRIGIPICLALAIWAGCQELAFLLLHR